MPLRNRSHNPLDEAPDFRLPGGPWSCDIQHPDVVFLDERSQQGGMSSGTLEVFVRAEQAAELPPGLARVLSMLAAGITSKPAA